MVFKFSSQRRNGISFLVVLFLLWGTSISALASQYGGQPTRSKERARNALKLGVEFFQSGLYFKSARYAFSAIDEGTPAYTAQAYALVTRSLIRAGLLNSASYFFVRALQQKDPVARSQVLVEVDNLVTHLGSDLFREYLLKYTHPKDYQDVDHGAYFYSLAKYHLLQKKEKLALQSLSKVPQNGFLRPFADQLEGSAHALRGDLEKSLQSFSSCVFHSEERIQRSSELSSKVSEIWIQKIKKDLQDLVWRCTAGKARVLYEKGDFEEAEIIYDFIPKSSFVWTEILFEQAWTAFARQDYNRALGKLVSYKSSHLDFVFNSEIEVLRAQSYLQLCLYKDANEVINQFSQKYGVLAKRLKTYIEKNSTDLKKFFEKGSKFLNRKLDQGDIFSHLVNRVVRVPYFQNLVFQENQIQEEMKAIQSFDRQSDDVRDRQRTGFPGFLRLVLSWRLKSIKELGGAYLQNSLLDHYQNLNDDFNKISFIKIEMLKQIKKNLVELDKDSSPSVETRFRGDISPETKGYQYEWGFNGEFWRDELGDYVFGLQSQCRT